MEMMTLTQLSKQTSVDPQTLCNYRDAYILYIPSVRVGRTIGFPAEAVPVVQTIHDLTTRGHERAEISAELEKSYPITVIAAQPVAKEQSLPFEMPAVLGLLKDVDSRYVALSDELVQIRHELGQTASKQHTVQIQNLITAAATTTNKHLEPLHTMSDELGKIRQAVGLLASRVERQGAAALQNRFGITASLEELANRLPANAQGLTSELNAVRHAIAELRETVSSEPAAGQETDAINQLSSEIGLLKLQLTDLHRERGQMISLMAALQDNLAQLHIELADARQRTIMLQQSEQAFPHLLSNRHPEIGMPLSGDRRAVVQPTPPDVSHAAMRRPRRLGHATK